MSATAHKRQTRLSLGDQMLAVSMWENGKDTLQIATILYCYEWLLWSRLSNWRKGIFDAS